MAKLTFGGLEVGASKTHMNSCQPQKMKALSVGVNKAARACGVIPVDGAEKLVIEDVEFEELNGASVTEGRRAIDLACRRYEWRRDRAYIGKSVIIFSIAVTISSTLLYFVGSTWLASAVLVVSAA
jgi:hypothetical protein